MKSNVFFVVISLYKKKLKNVVKDDVNLINFDVSDCKLLAFRRIRL